ncbi:hypothetical protein KbCgl_20490 [Corynebacterium glutamicum]|nr:hypothetical protein KbCgl_20490 [Corynebacterium glutamicum]
MKKFPQNREKFLKAEKVGEWADMNRIKLQKRLLFGFNQKLYVGLQWGEKLCDVSLRQKPAETTLGTL